MSKDCVITFFCLYLYTFLYANIPLWNFSVYIHMRIFLELFIFPPFFHIIKCPWNSPKILCCLVLKIIGVSKSSLWSNMVQYFSIII